MIDATRTPPVTPEDVAELLRDLPAIRELPENDPRRVAWLERKRDLLDRIGRR